MKKLTLGLCLVTSSAALAHDMEYKVCKGDTLQTIASKFHVSGKKILHVNELMPDHHMRPGHFLLIPGVSERAAAKYGHSKIQAKAKGSHLKPAAHGLVAKTTVHTYTVRNGDQDWALAKKSGLSLHALHVANPGVDWDHLKIGLKLRLPHTITVAPAHTLVASTAHHRVAMSAAKSGGVHMKAHWHTVAQGENDWIIAHKAGIRLPLLKALNPELVVSNLRPGQKVRVPGSSVARMALQVKRIHSSHVAINGDNVTIRTEAGVGAESICTVDAGTVAAVVDHDGNWYQLKFPKGTVGWVRGDLLKPAHVFDHVERVAKNDNDDDGDDNDQPQHHAHHNTVVAKHVSHSSHVDVPEHYHTVVAESAHHHELALENERRHHELALENEQRHHELALAHHNARLAARAHRHHSEHSTTTTYTAMDEDAGDAQGVLHEAHQMRGTRYRWGAASRGATDCSGFALQVFRKNGYRLPRTSTEQSTVGTRVSRGDLKPGDLVFFHTRGRSYRVSHVGIYEGNGKFIHASSGGGKVQENSLNDAYYAHHYSGARSIIHRHSHKVVAKAESKHSEKDPAPVADAPASASTDPSAPVTAR